MLSGVSPSAWRKLTQLASARSSGSEGAFGGLPVRRPVGTFANLPAKLVGVLVGLLIKLAGAFVDPAVKPVGKLIFGCHFWATNRGKLIIGVEIWVCIRNSDGVTTIGFHGLRDFAETPSR